MKIRIVKLPPENREWTVIGGRDGTFEFHGLVAWRLKDLRHWLSEWCSWTNIGEEDE